MINCNFIRNWIPDDKDNPDEAEYQAILKIIQENDLHIDRIIFERLYDWKASRSKNYLDLNNYGIYKSAFNEIPNIKDDEKINFYKKNNERDKLPGILEPVASTILHFMYPNKFPIRDVRTVGTLTDKGYLSRKVSYKEYRTKIFKIYNDCKGKYSLREIDRALFTYNEEKDLFLNLLEGKTEISDIAKNLDKPEERREELISDLENYFKKKLQKLKELKTEL